MKKYAVLFVDDELNVLSAIKRGLYKEKYDRFFANSGQEALEILEDNEIHVVVSDMKMPGMTGLDLLKIVNEKYPETIKMILSGYTHLPQIIATINHVNLFRFIPKPWDLDNELKKGINDAIELYSLRENNIILNESLEKKNAVYQKLLKSTNMNKALIKRDLEYVGEYFGNVFRQLEKEMKKHSDCDGKIMDTSNILGIYQRFSLTLPSQFQEFTLKRLRDELMASLNIHPKGKEHHFNQHFSIPVKKKEAQFQLYGNYLGLKTIIKLIIETFLQSSLFISINTRIEEDTDKEIRWVYLVISDAEERDDIEFDPRALETIKGLMKFINGELSIEKTTDDLEVILLKIRCHIKKMG